MRQTHVAGERLFVDCAGKTLDVVDGSTGEIFKAQLGASRRALFETIEQSTLKPLPAEPYVYAEWAACKVGLDYHVDVDKHYYTVHCARVPRLFADLELAHGDGRFPCLFRMLVKADLLILDDWGPDRLNPNQRRDLMEIVEDRYGHGSTLITS